VSGGATVRRRFGQHFLEPAWVAKVVAAIDPSRDEAFVEIGPGRGALTFPLVARAAGVVGIEIDRDLASALRARKIPGLDVVTADVLTVDWAALLDLLPPGPVRIAGNLPYYISTPLIFRLIDMAQHTPRIRDAVLMLQAEVAERLTAPPGTKRYGVLSILAQPAAKVTALMRLPPGAFRPAPQVSSSLVRFEFHPPRLGRADPALFERLVRHLFAHRRKMLGTTLRGFADERGYDATSLIRKAGLSPRQRPETLELADLIRLTELMGVLPGAAML
jgi:16S rRNA (adenine1518-N6/adenine1519-N6)-dimethyltransferase